MFINLASQYRKHLTVLLVLVVQFLIADTLFAQNLSMQDLNMLKQFAAQNPQVVSQLQGAAQTGQSSQSLDPKTMSTVQAFLVQNPQVAQQVQNVMQGKQSSDNSKTSNQANMQTQNASTAQAASTTTEATDDTSDDAIPSDKPYQPWQPADQNEADANNAAFRGLANQAFPLSPEQIKTLSSMLDATQRAQAAAPNDRPPMPTSTSLLVDLDPGATPPVIRLSRGFVSSLVFVDATGAPWPIEAYDLGDPKAFNIQWNKKSNTLMVQAMSAYNYGNLAVKLQDLNTPVMLTLVPGQQQIDYRVDLRLPEKGPLAKATIQGSELPEQADKTLLNILDGVSPQGAKRLDVSGGVAQAWLLGDALYVRTRFTLLSPAWMSKMSSADGMNAYKLQLTPLLLVSRYGKVMQLKVEGI